MTWKIVCGRKEMGIGEDEAHKKRLEVGARGPKTAKS